MEKVVSSILTSSNDFFCLLGQCLWTYSHMSGWSVFFFPLFSNFLKREMKPKELKTSY